MYNMCVCVYMCVCVTYIVCAVQSNRYERNDVSIHSIRIFIHTCMHT